MKTAEMILRQVLYLRRCFERFQQDATDYASVKNKFEIAEASAGFDLLNGHQIFNSAGEQIFLTNDTTRKYYVKEKTVVCSQMMNQAKETRDVSAKRVEVEISVLSALKQIAENEVFDDDLLAKFDVSAGEI